MADHPAGISHRRRVSGVGHWRWQRYSAVLVLLLMAYLVILTAGLGTLDQGGATALVSQPINALALAVLVSVGMWHGTLGLQVVIEDYVSVGAGRHAERRPKTGTASADDDDIIIMIGNFISRHQVNPFQSCARVTRS